MEYQNFGNMMVVRLDKGDKIAESLLKAVKAERLSSASITGIGAVDDFEVGVFDLEKSDYNRFHYTGNHEINSLVGNLTAKDGAPYLHLHITCTDQEGKVVGGHLLDGNISLTAEIFLQPFDAKIERKYDETLGINQIRFE